MDIVTTSLDALLHKATNTYNHNIDTAAVEAFCALMSKEKDGYHIGSKLLANRIHSKNENEALNTFMLLDVCMKRCNNAFQSEIGKFRFLNEMIKLVSPKYLGSQTPLSLKQKVLQLLYLWTLDYPKETKIKEAYDMLKKQGVIREIPLSISADNASIPERNLGNSVFLDEEKNRLLQKLLQSKNPEDLQAANRLIKNMVKEDDKRAELKSRRIIELESVHHHVRLLNEMLDSYKQGFSSISELELIKELHQSCERLRPNVFKLVAETQQNEGVLNEVLQASDELGLVFDKFTEVIIKRKTQNSEASGRNLSLLDFGSPEELCTKEIPNDRLNNVETLSDMDLLSNIFISNVPDAVLKPISTTNTVVETEKEDAICKPNKLKALDDLDALGEHLMKENMVSQRMGPQFNKIPDKIPMNLLVKQSSLESKASNQTEQTDSALGNAFNLDLNYLLDKKNQNEDSSLTHNHDLGGGDDVLVDISNGSRQLEHSDLVAISIDTKDVPVNVAKASVVENNTQGSPSFAEKTEPKLSEISVRLEEIKPSLQPPLVVLEERNGITVTLHFGKNKPRHDVNVIVITTISKNELPLSNFLFQAVVPKMCKLKLQPPSSTELPAHNPFLPPSAITQIMLIANPEQTNISLKFIISYVMDEETVTEMGEVDSLPILAHS